MRSFRIALLAGPGWGEEGAAVECCAELARLGHAALLVDPSRFGGDGSEDRTWALDELLRGLDPDYVSYGGESAEKILEELADREDRGPDADEASAADGGAADPESELAGLRGELASVRRELWESWRQVDELRNSDSFKVGNALMRGPAALKRLVGRG